MVAGSGQRVHVGHDGGDLCMDGPQVHHQLQLFRQARDLVHHHQESDGFAEAVH